MASYPGKSIKFSVTEMASGESVLALQRQLNKRGYLKASLISGYYDLYTEKAVKNLQSASSVPPTGIVDLATWKLIFDNSGVNSDIAQGSVESAMATVKKPGTEVLPIHSYDGTPKHTPFFHLGNTKKLRRTGMDLKIDFGANNAMSKTIKNIALRSVGLELDASGNPLYEVFEFIGQDVDESDNKTVK